MDKHWFFHGTHSIRITATDKLTVVLSAMLLVAVCSENPGQPFVKSNTAYPYNPAVTDNYYDNGGYNNDYYNSYSTQTPNVYSGNNARAYPDYNPYNQATINNSRFSNPFTRYQGSSYPTSNLYNTHRDQNNYLGYNPGYPGYNSAYKSGYNPAYPHHVGYNPVSSNYPANPYTLNASNRYVNSNPVYPGYSGYNPSSQGDYNPISSNYPAYPYTLNATNRYFNSNPVYPGYSGYNPSSQGDYNPYSGYNAGKYSDRKNSDYNWSYDGTTGSYPRAYNNGAYNALNGKFPYNNQAKQR
uniref:Prisilkin-39 n=1 Tax=Timema douglasi TaxID=61478 RepID=A0A7R8VDJ4_TIMDO|nr:unnamed protein product [Timema douglasi]